MSLIDDLNMWQTKVLEAAGCIERTAQVGYSRMPFRFTEDWYAEQARVALAVLPDGVKVLDRSGAEWTSKSKPFSILENYSPYDIVVDEPKPEWTVDSLRWALYEGRNFVLKKEGYLDMPLKGMPEHYLEANAKLAINHAANGWQIEEIV
jgi:hypothetical protein